MTSTDSATESTTPLLKPSVVERNTKDFASKSGALNELDDKRITTIKPLIPPQILMEDFPLDDAAAATVSLARQEAEAIIKGKDDRLLVVIGPCSIHDVDAAKEYGSKLKKLTDELRHELCIVMRVYFEKPRTTVGWKGLINDPHMDGTFAINKGLKVARGLLLHLNQAGIPTGCEFLDTLTPQYIGDLVSWGAIGARTTESQVHRELASGLSVPVGFKNGTDGNVGIAVDAMRAAAAGHHFLSVTKQGLSAIVATSGNDSCHIILRGSNTGKVYSFPFTLGPNYDARHVKACAEKVSKSMPETECKRVMIDCSHGNSQKQHSRQIAVVEDICQQMETGLTSQDIMGVMIESHLIEGRQNIPEEGKAGLVYGQSITDACIGWQDTEKVLNRLAKAVQARRIRK